MLRSPPSSSLLPLVRHCTVGHTWIVLSFKIFAKYEKHPLFRQSIITDKKELSKFWFSCWPQKLNKASLLHFLFFDRARPAQEDRHRSKKRTPVWHKLWVRSVGRLWAAGLTILPRPSFHGWRLLDRHHKYMNNKYRNTQLVNRLSLDFAFNRPSTLSWPTSFRASYIADLTTQEPFVKFIVIVIRLPLFSHCHIYELLYLSHLTQAFALRKKKVSGQGYIWKASLQKNIPLLCKLLLCR